MPTSSVYFFALDRGREADRFRETALVEPGGPGKRPVLDLLEVPPRSLAEDPLGLVEPASAGPGRDPWSRSACRTRLRSVTAAHPILSAIEPMAARWDTCFPWCSTTVRIARSGTSAKTCFEFPSLDPLVKRNLPETRSGQVALKASQTLALALSPGRAPSAVII